MGNVQAQHSDADVAKFPFGFAQVGRVYQAWLDAMPAPEWTRELVSAQWAAAERMTKEVGSTAERSLSYARELTDISSRMQQAFWHDVLPKAWGIGGK